MVSKYRDILEPPIEQQSNSIPASPVPANRPVASQTEGTLIYNFFFTNFTVLYTTNCLSVSGHK